MKINAALKSSFIYIIALSQIILFTYAAVTKILDFQNFQVQIGQSPLLSAFTTCVSYGVPLVELILVLLLLFPKYRWIGLYGSFLLMVMFSAYIFTILNYSSFVPCSCGGILEKMTWNQHLIFNIIFVVLGALAIILQSAGRFVYGFLSIYLITGVGIIAALFLLSEDIMQHRNNFIRRLPEQVNKIYDTDLKFNSYYFAGEANGKIYLGNVTMPLLLTEIDTTLKTKKTITVTIDKMELPFRSVQINVKSDYFFVSDGTIPAVFRGKTGTWAAKSCPITSIQFSNQVFIDSISMAYRTRADNNEGVLGYTNFSQNQKTYVNSLLLQRQIDGIFDTDGLLTYDKATKKAVYLYYYRNQYIVADSELNLNSRGKTIDTTSKAQIKVVFNKDRNEWKMAAPPLIVNKNGYLYKGLLFVNAALIGKFEDAKMWNQTSMIDVYDTTNNTYIQSFYIYNIQGKKLARYIVVGDNFYGLVGTHIVCYKLNKIITNRYSQVE
jgi:hypothetical protein